MKYDLSVLIPARNEEFLYKTIEDILSDSGDKTEIIAGLDGAWAEPAIKDNPRVTIVHVSESLGQRAMTNQLCRLSQAKYVMKCDAHCAFDKDFDSKMIAKMQDNYTMIPIMRNLWVFDWKCYDCGKRSYQSPTPEKCIICGGHNLKKKMTWVAKCKENNGGHHYPQSTSYMFDPEPHFQYFNDYTKRPEYQEMLAKEGLTETMSLQGSCWMATRDKYWELDLCNEEFGKKSNGWGSQGIEVACKTWLSGGRLVVNHDTWYGHLFRTQGGDFGFPYPGPDANPAKKHAKDLFFNNKWDKQIHPLSWLVEKFWPVPGWTQEDLDKIKGGDDVRNTT